MKSQIKLITQATFAVLVSLQFFACTNKHYRDIYVTSFNDQTELFNRLALEYLDRAWSPGLSENNVQMEHYVSEPQAITNRQIFSGGDERLYLVYQKRSHFAQITLGSFYLGTIGATIFNLDFNIPEETFEFQREYFLYSDPGVDPDPSICLNYGVAPTGSGTKTCPYGFNRDHPSLQQTIFEIPQINFLNGQLVVMRRFDFVGRDEYISLPLAPFNTFFPFALGRRERYSLNFPALGSGFSKESPIRMSYYDEGLAVARLPGYSMTDPLTPVWRMYNDPNNPALGFNQSLGPRFLTIISPDPALVRKGIVLQEVPTSTGTEYYEYANFQINDVGNSRGVFSYEILLNPVRFYPGGEPIAAPATLTGGSGATQNLVSRADRSRLGKIVQSMNQSK